MTARGVCSGVSQEKHYKGLVKPNAATKFWQLTPANFLRASSAA